MWDTTKGVRILQGSESGLVRDTIGDLVDVIRAAKADGESASVGVTLFDELSWEQQLAMLLKVAKQLLDPRRSPLPKSALMDATAAAIYAQMRIGVEIEINLQQSATETDDNDTARRQEIVNALIERYPDRDWLDAECIVADEWDLAVDVLRNWVLADEDWNLQNLSIDLEPEKANLLKASLGIDRDYFIDVPPDGDERPPRIVWADLIELVTSERPDPAVFV